MRPSVAVPLVLLLVCVTALALFERHVRWLGDDSFWKVILSSDVPNYIRICTALAVALGMSSLWRLLKPGRVSWFAWNAEAAQAFAELGGPRPARADGLVWGEAERAAIAFRRVGGLLLALGDPAGAAPDRISAIWRLRDLARQEGRDPAIWGARRALLEVYADLGLAALPLGPDGLPAAAGAAAAAERFLACVAERDLPTLMPLLPDLARDRSLNPEPDPTRPSPELARA
jgi:phosphatidylglycerol lysyltransferase